MRNIINRNKAEVVRFSKVIAGNQFNPNLIFLEQLDLLPSVSLKRLRDETVPKVMTERQDGPHIEHSRVQSNEYNAINLIHELHEEHGNFSMIGQ